MSNKEKPTTQMWATGEHLARNETLAVIKEAIHELYREGQLMKSLDSQGRPRLRNREHIYIHVDRATAAERSFWLEENRPSYN